MHIVQLHCTNILAISSTDSNFPSISLFFRCCCFFLISYFGGLVQMAERPLYMWEVSGDRYPDSPNVLILLLNNLFLVSVISKKSPLTMTLEDLVDINKKAEHNNKLKNTKFYSLCHCLTRSIKKQLYQIHTC